MDQKKLEFQKIRDFGENITDTFKFIRQESRPLLRSFFAICTIFILLNAIFAAMFQYSLLKVTPVAAPGSYAPNYAAQLGKIFSPVYFLTILTSLLAVSAMQVALTGYVKLYVQKGNESPDIEEVWRLFRKYFIKVFLFHIPTLIITLVGMVFCLAPGVYFFVVFAPLGAILVIEEMSFGEAFSRCFYLVKNEFWLSFGIYIISFILYYIATMLIGGIFSGAGIVVKLLTTRDFTDVQQMASSFMNFFGLAFYIIPLLSVTLNYFSLVEKKDGTGIINRLDSIGEKQSDDNDSEEEY